MEQKGTFQNIGPFNVQRKRGQRIDNCCIGTVGAKINGDSVGFTKDNMVDFTWNTVNILVSKTLGA